MGYPISHVIPAVALFNCQDVESIDHDKVQPFTQPEPITISEKSGVKFEPVVFINDGCASYPAVNAAGEITGGLKGTKGASDCTDPPFGTQTYGRASWHNDKYAIMFAWYFPKGKTTEWAGISC
ncbi:unnamed protein product [Phytophthora lilii]|uniref:Unnamed protein product n=1 Tax=Phytophthora lilii TaxID=2077276 RepID=A0A9W6TV12_9STRA|nr:unnamed protein product [Phytophthora lilii]